MVVHTALHLLSTSQATSQQHHSDNACDVCPGFESVLPQWLTVLLGLLCEVLFDGHGDVVMFWVVVNGKVEIEPAPAFQPLCIYICICTSMPSRVTRKDLVVVITIFIKMHLT